MHDGEDVKPPGPHQTALMHAREEMEMLAHDIERLFVHVEPHLRPIEPGPVQGSVPMEGGVNPDRAKPTSSSTGAVRQLGADISAARDRIRHLIQHIEV